MKKFDVITIGSAVRDILFRTDAAEIVKNPKHDPTKLALIGFEYGAKIHSKQVHRYYGGGASNTAVAMARLGLKVAIATRVGNDPDGQAITAHFKAQHVGTQFIQHDPKHNTGLSFLIIETKTNEHVALVDYGANQHFVLPQAVVSAAPRWFYVSALSTPSWASIMRQLTKTKAKLAWNPGSFQLAGYKQLVPLLKKTAVLILNKDEATELSVRTKLAPAQFGAEIVVVTDGRHGAVAYTKQRAHKVTVSAKPAKDTTGAGDAFGSSLVAGLIRTNGNLPLALQIAAINATAEVSHIGVQQGLLRWPDIQKQLKRRR